MFCRSNWKAVLLVLLAERNTRLRTCESGQHYGSDDIHPEFVTPELGSSECAAAALASLWRALYRGVDLLFSLHPKAKT
jgi:hypothetical protein